MFANAHHNVPNPPENRNDRMRVKTIAPELISFHPDKPILP